MYPYSAHIVTIVPHGSPLLLLLSPYIIIVMSVLIMLWPLRLLYIERRSFHLYHQRTVHLCNVKEVVPSKRLNSKVLIYLFYLFLSWFHNIFLYGCSRRNTQSPTSKLLSLRCWSAYCFILFCANTRFSFKSWRTCCWCSMWSSTA